MLRFLFAAILIFQFFALPAHAAGTQPAEKLKKPSKKVPAATAKEETPPSGKKSEQSDASGALSTKEISSQMADIWCQKMEECATKKEMGPLECKKVLFKSFKDGFANVPEGQKIDVTQDTLSQCVSNIKKDTCDSIKNAQTIPHCEFISQLNQGN